MDVTLRHATAADLDAAVAIIRDSMNALRERHGFGPPAALPPTTFQRLCLAVDPSALWVAEAGGAVVGFAMAWMAGRFWFLSQLFVRPGLQSGGVGQALLSRALDHAQRNGAENRALVTFAYNPHSTGLYLRNGLHPRELLYVMSAPAARLRHEAWPRDAVETAPIPASDAAAEWIGRLDEAVLGFRRVPHHAFLLGGAVPRALRIGPAGAPLGYAYVSAAGEIGPVAITPGAEAGLVLGAAIGAALDGGASEVTLTVPAAAEPVLAMVARAGFRIREPDVLMSEKPFGDWRHYLPRHPGFL